jgi:hypothetical protein
VLIHHFFEFITDFSLLTTKLLLQPCINKKIRIKPPENQRPLPESSYACHRLNLLNFLLLLFLLLQIPDVFLPEKEKVKYITLGCTKPLTPVD